ncbi:hypothetical protein JYU34_017931 [Plutella xylostella]|uniref:Protein TEX261 n=2 Tax=Plutella xylostella TaxID=51655 RepID=A0A8S4DZ15_PLUXY|nr:hypothetical protein JYU34_017931 [Plutella xylostella]CAG9106401.1 unnamed protein product [Plutella xylostella]
MLFIYILSYLAMLLQAVFLTLATATGLYYLAELVEEYTVIAKHVITWLIVGTAVVHIGFLIFEDLPATLSLLGLFQQLIHCVLLKDFPSVRVTSIPFVLGVTTLVAHHYYAFKYFGDVYYSLTEVLGYFTICLWLVPFGFFVSLSANDYVLPTTGERQHLLGDHNVVTDYLSRKSKRYSLLSFFSFAKDTILPQRAKKTF